MNILVTAPYGMYLDFSSSFIHNQAKEYVCQGHRVRVILPLAVGKRPHRGGRFGAPVIFLEQDGVELCYVRHVSLSNFGIKHFNTTSLLAMLRMCHRQVLKDFSPDVIHAHTVEYGGKVGAFFKQLCDIPLVLTTHGGDTNTVLEQGEIHRLKPWCDGADLLTACSKKLAENLSLCGTKTPAHAICNGFAAEHVQQREKAPFRLLQVGNLVPTKHTEYTIRAVAKLRERYPDITLTIVGNGSERSRLEQLSCDLGLQETVRFTGALSNPEALAEMAEAEVFCMPSYPEGFGIVYLEAMASGCVTIGTRGEGIDGVIVDGENGFLVPRDDVDAIVEVIDRCFRDAELARRVSAAGRATAKTLTWDTNAMQYIHLFENLIRGENMHT